MEIHPPAKPIESVRDFLVHLSMIVIGILIALGLEQSVETWHHHALGREARDNILSEIRDNKKEIDQERANVKKNQATLVRTLATVRDFLAHKKITHAEMSMRVNGATLSSTSWTTAAATGALAYMGYDETKRFAKAYDLQSFVQRTQEEEFRMVTSPIAIVSFSPGGPDTLSDEQLRTVENQLLSLLASVTLWDQLAGQLSEEYGRVLETR
jgi:hypothetical protein